MIVEDLHAKHWGEVSQIYSEGIRTGNATFETEVPDWERWDAAHLPYGRFVATEGGRVLGWAALSPVSGRCVYAGVAETSVYVGEGSRGKGVGAVLLSALVEASEANGIWTLQAGIFPENLGSVRLHQKFGFREVGRRSRIGQLNGVWRDTLLLERRVGDPQVGSTSENNKAAIRRLIREVDNGNLAVLEECFAEGYVDHKPAGFWASAYGNEGASRVFAHVAEAFPDASHTIEDLVAEGDRVVARISATGTHLGTLGDIPPSGLKVKMTGIAIYRFEGGKIAERWVEQSADLLSQLRCNT